MSPEELRVRIETRATRIADNLAGVAGCMAGVGPGSPPDRKTLAALAWLLGSTYSEAEETLKAIAQYYREPVPSSTTWHRDLLDQMARPTSNRLAVLSPASLQDLDQLRAFRHFSRNATFPVLDWEQMRPNVEILEPTVTRLLADVRAHAMSL